MGETADTYPTGVSIRLQSVNPTTFVIGKPWLAIDGLFPAEMSWGEEFFPLPTGNHTVQCGVKLSRGFKIVSRDFQFTVAERKTTRIRWRAPLVPTRPTSGRWKLLKLA
jgi:hypothetical protein